MEYRTTPYDPSEQRVAAFFVEAGTGGGADPIGALIALHRYAMGEWNHAKADLTQMHESNGWQAEEIGRLRAENEKLRAALKAAKAKEGRWPG